MGWDGKWKARVLGSAGVLLPLLSSGCVAPQSDAVTNLITSTTSTSTVNASGGDIYLNVDTAWEMTDTVFTRQGSCQVNTGDLTRTKTCLIHVPEGQLFYSKTKLSFGTANTSLCKRIQFFPAFYQITNQNGVNWALSSATTLNCSTSSIVAIPGIPGYPSGDVNCFWGPGRYLYSTWPSPIGKYINTIEGTLNESSETIDSGNDLSKTNPVTIDGNWFSNLAVANHITDPTNDVVSPAGDAVYAGGTMQPYRARCVDDYEQVQAEVIVDIADSDLETGEDPGGFNNDQFYDFEETD